MRSFDVVEVLLSSCDHILDLLAHAIGQTVESHDGERGEESSEEQEMEPECNRSAVARSEAQRVQLAGELVEETESIE